MHGAAVGVVDTADEVEERRLARAAASHHRESLARADLGIETVEHAVHTGAFVEAAGELANSQHACPGRVESVELIVESAACLPSTI